MIHQQKYKMQSSNKNLTLSTKANGTHTSFRTGSKTQRRPISANLPYADKPLKKQLISWNQSTATWRNSAKKYSFPRDKRFRTTQPISLDIIEPQLPDTKSKKSCSFGKGKKKPISVIVLKNAQEKPGPDAYDLSFQDQSPRKKNKGKTFGQNWKKYEKIYINHRKDVYSEHFTQHNPGHKYQTRESPGKDSQSKTISTRQKMFTQKMADMMNYVPGPRYNLADRRLYNTKGLNQRNFSFGERLDLSAPANNYPGCQYIIGGFCDKFLNTKKKSCPIN